MVAINGPLEVHSNLVVQEALDNYWRKQKMLGNRGGPYVISEAVDSIVNRARRAVHVHVDGGLHEVYVTEVEGLSGSPLEVFPWC